MVSEKYKSTPFVMFYSLEQGFQGNGIINNTPQLLSVAKIPANAKALF